MLKLSFIGCGDVGKTMGYLWHKSESVKIVDVVNRTQESANKSIEFIGSGNALASMKDLHKADVFIIACGDDAIEACCDELANVDIIEENNIVFHFSGSKSANVLKSAKESGAFCASLHPVKSFANPADAIKTFTGTYCGLEGDSEACEVLRSLVEAIGGNCFDVNGDKKLSYHAASVFACNYLTALQELSLRSLEYSGVDRELAMKILEPMVKETSENIFKLGTAKALTGPIARGDEKLVSEQFNVVKNWNKQAGEIYRLLGQIGADLSENKGVATQGEITKIRSLLD